MGVCQLSRCWGPDPIAGGLFPVLETSRKGGHFMGSREASGQQEEGRWSFRVNLKSPMLGVHLGPRAAFREDAGFPGELEASSRPPASRGRNAKDQLSAELRLPFRGAPGAGPSRAAELTGSVCPTGRTAPAKNSVLPCAGRRDPGPRPWESGPRQSKEPVEPRTPHPGAWSSPTPEAAAEAAGTALSAQVPRRVEGQRAEERPRPSGMGAGGAASRALAWASLPLLGPPAGALCEDTLCCRGKAGPAACAPPLFPGTCWRLFLLTHPRSAAGGERGENPGVRTGLWEWSQALSANSPFV